MQIAHSIFYLKMQSTDYIFNPLGGDRMPNRIIKESICASETIECLSWFEEVFFYRLIVNCDDYGRMDARPAILKASLFPLKDGITKSQIEKAVTALSTAGLVDLYVVDGHPYLQLCKWAKHQRLRNSREKYPVPCENTSPQLAATRGEPPLARAQNPIQSESNPNPNPNPIYAGKPQQTKFIPPSVDEVSAYCSERNNGVDANRFVDHYEAKGWMIGKNKMKDWRAAVRTWEGKEAENGRSTGKAEHAGNTGEWNSYKLNLD